MQQAIKYDNETVGAELKDTDKVYTLEFSLRNSVEDSSNVDPITDNTDNTTNNNTNNEANTTGKNLSLLKFIVPAPNQEGAGSCHYMANTGAMEILLNQKDRTQGAARTNNDLSEGYLIGLKGYQYGVQLIKSFQGRAAKATNLPFINSRSVSNGNARDNWNSSISGISTRSVPGVTTKILGGTMDLSDNSKWSVGNFGNDIIEKIKTELDAGNPVVVNYNHLKYWHVVVIVGYDNNQSTQCSWVENAINYSSYDSNTRNRIYNAYKSDGGCSGHGVFYVRDSLGYGTNGDDRAPSYGKRSYEWFKHLGSKAFSVKLH